VRWKDLIAAVLKLGSNNIIWPGVTIGASTFLFGAVLLSVMSIFIQPAHKGAYALYHLLKSAASDELLPGLDREVEEWCKDISGVVRRKHNRIKWSLGMLACGIAMMVVCISVHLVRHDKTPPDVLTSTVAARLATAAPLQGFPGV
jgi:hypothetical protein